MLAKNYLLITCCFSIAACQQSPLYQTQTKDTPADLTAYVDPFWGVEGGNVFPGACVPFGMVRICADGDPRTGGLPTSGYTSDKPVIGFSHTHLSGTGGGGRFGNILFTPTVGSVGLHNRASVKRGGEFAAPGIYGITLQRTEGDVQCKMTATHRAALHSYIFNNWKKEDTITGNVLIDIAHTISRTPAESATGGSVKITGTNSIEGHGSYKGGWGGENPYTVYFYAEFDTPFDTAGVWNNNVFTGEKSKTGQFCGAFASFKLKQYAEVKVKVGISFLSIEKARANLSEISGFDFELTRLKADQAWNSRLNAMKIEGGTPETRSQFYSGLYHTMIMPTDMTGENSLLPADAPYYTEHYCIWDVFRCLMPLHTLIYPEKQTDIVKSLLSIYEKKGWLPDAWIAGGYGQIQGGTNADVVMADAVVKNLPIDKEKALAATLKNAQVVSDNPDKYGRYPEYHENGYLYKSINSVSRSLEYAYNDFCIAQISKALGKDEITKEMLKRSESWKLFYDEKNRAFWGVDSTGNIKPNFTMEFTRSDHWNDEFFYEGNARLYRYYVPHDIPGLIKKHGGNESFVADLNEIFETNKFGLGNEPSFLTPYLFNYAGRQDLTAKNIHALLRREYTPGRRGLPGQDDSGAMSAWYLWAVTGIYPVAGQTVYLIGTPAVEKTVFNLPTGASFTIKAHNLSDKNFYSEKVLLNGKELQKPFLEHADIIGGGTLEFYMSSKPRTW